jgi:hypothetical protein
LLQVCRAVKKDVSSNGDWERYFTARKSDTFSSPRLLVTKEHCFVDAVGSETALFGMGKGDSLRLEDSKPEMNFGVNA